MTRTRRRARNVTAILAAGLAGALIATVPTAQADTTTTDNPWQYTMTDPGPGLTITGDDGAQNDPAFLVEDYLGQPIFTVLEAGGAAVLGDDFRIMHGSDPFNGQITLSQNNPTASVCVREHQMWIGGTTGGIWECKYVSGAYSWQPWTG